jgi:hypothetical protein
MVYEGPGIARGSRAAQAERLATRFSSIAEAVGSERLTGVFRSSTSTTPSRRGSKPPSIRPSRIITHGRRCPRPARAQGHAARLEALDNAGGNLSTSPPKLAPRDEVGKVDRLLHRQLPQHRPDHRLADIGEDRASARASERPGEAAVGVEQDQRRHRRARALAPATALAAGRPSASVGEKLKSVIWLLRKKPSTIRPEPKMLSTVVVMLTTLPALSPTMKWLVPAGSSVRSAPPAARRGGSGDRRRARRGPDQRRTLRDIGGVEQPLDRHLHEGRIGDIAVAVGVHQAARLGEQEPGLRIGGAARRDVGALEHLQQLQRRRRRSTAAAARRRGRPATRGTRPRA